MSRLPIAERSFAITDRISAPREDVFHAWTDPTELSWFFTDRTPKGEPIEVDLVRGGEWRQRMFVDDDTVYVTGGVYLDIVPVERLTFVWGAHDGWPLIDDERPEESPIVTVTFAEDPTDANVTVQTLRMELDPALPPDRVHEWLTLGCDDGWRQTVARLMARFDR